MKSAEGVNLSPLYGSLRRVRLSPTYASLPVRLSPLYCFLRCTGLSVWCERSAWCKASVVRGEHGVRRAAAWCEDGRDERVLSVVQGERGAKEEGPKRAASDLYESGAASTAPSGSSSDSVHGAVGVVVGQGQEPPCGPGGRGGRGARGVWCERRAWCKASGVREHQKGRIASEGQDSIGRGQANIERGRIALKGAG